MASSEATFSIKIPVDSQAAGGAKSVDDLRRSLLAAQEQVKKFSDLQKNLKGKTDEVVKARTKFRALAQTERDKISQLTLALSKHGAGTHDAKAKIDKLNEKLKEVPRSSQLAEAAISKAGLALAGFGAALVAGVGALGAWAIAGANAYRTMSLMREAAADGKENAAALGTQIQALAQVTPKSVDELNRLSVSLSKALVNTRGFAGEKGGQALIDTMNAVAQASSAMGDEVGAKFEEIAKRGRQFGRVGIGLLELQGTGVSTRDVAAQLATNMKVGVNKALEALVFGRVKVGDAMKAIRQTVENKFGDINLRRMLDLNVMATKFKDTLRSLTRDINLDPMLRAIQSVAKNFSESTVTGATLKRLIAEFGNTIVKVVAASGPVITKFIQSSIVLFLKLQIAALDIATALNNAFGINLVTMFDSGKGAADRLGEAFAGMGKYVEHTAEQITQLIAGLKSVIDLVSKLESVRSKVLGTEALGKGLSGAAGSGIGAKFGDNLIKSFKGALFGGGSQIFDAAAKLGGAAKGGMSDSLEIHSPSKVFERMGRQSREGYELGLSGAPINASPRIEAGSLRGGGTSVGAVTVNVSFPNVQDGKQAARELSSPSFRAQFLRMLEGLTIERGAGTQKAEAT